MGRERDVLESDIGLIVGRAGEQRDHWTAAPVANPMTWSYTAAVVTAMNLVSSRAVLHEEHAKRIGADAAKSAATRPGR